MTLKTSFHHGDIASQKEAFNPAIAANVDGIAVSGSQPGVLNDEVKLAKEKGHSSIFITHNIHHVFQVVDRIVVMRRGKKVGDVHKADTTIEEIEDVITGIVDSIGMPAQ